MWCTTCGRYTASTGGIQSSKLSGKYSYSISAVSSGLPADFCRPLTTAAPDPADLAPTNCGLCMLSPEADDRLGLRSSSDRERLIGRVAEDAPRGTAEAILEGGLVNLLRTEGLVLVLVSEAVKAHEGTGGRVMLGETATFLLGCGLGFGVEKGWGVVDHSLDCCCMFPSE